jgi:hypothetical protein
MFKVGESIICVDVENESYKYRGVVLQKDNITSVTIGKIYVVIESDEFETSVLDNRGIKRKYRASRFMSLLQNRKQKIEKICSKLVI